MFYCEQCREKNGWPEGWVLSRGNCECCNDYAVCHDTPSSMLPTPKQDKEKPTPNAALTGAANLTTGDGAA